MAERLCNMDDKQAAVPGGEDSLSVLREDVILNMDDKKEAVSDGKDRSSALPKDVIGNMDDKKEEAMPYGEDRSSALPEDVIGNMDDKKEAVPDGEDRLSVLPEDVILLLLSFLPTQEAVQTCVLGPRWRTLWKSVPCLFLKRSHSLVFINSLIRSRGPTPLDECVILVQDDCTEECHKDAERWLRYVVSCKVRVLTFEMVCCTDGLQLSAGALASEHLTRLVLFRMKSEDFCLDVLSCQSLEELEIYQSTINIGITGTVFPKSLRLLVIRDAKFLPEDTRSSISAPGLVTLELVNCWKWTPFLQSMPSLIRALIRIEHVCLDSSYYNFCGVCGGRLCVQCYGIDDCVLLKSLSGATSLELLSPRSTIFRRELKWCPMFSNLKRLLLCDWFMTANFSGLVYFLQHSPVLEMLALQLSNTKKIETSVVYKPEKQFLVSEHLKAVEIEYCEEVRTIDEILIVLAYHGVKPELINIERKPFTECSFFED